MISLKQTHSSVFHNGAISHMNMKSFRASYVFFPWLPKKRRHEVVWIQLRFFPMVAEKT